MIKLSKNSLVTFFAITFTTALPFSLHSEDAVDSQDERIETGKEIAYDRKRGNCLACHYVQTDQLMGTTGPALIAMKARFPDREKLVSQIYDARLKNENTMMPPFGAHGSLSGEEIDLVVDWLYTL